MEVEAMLAIILLIVGLFGVIGNTIAISILNRSDMESPINFILKGMTIPIYSGSLNIVIFYSKTLSLNVKSLCLNLYLLWTKNHTNIAMNHTNYSIKLSPFWTKKFTMLTYSQITLFEFALFEDLLQFKFWEIMTFKNF